MGQCIPPLKSDTSSCSTDEDCFTNYGKSKIYGSCECAGNSLSDKVCS